MDVADVHGHNPATVLPKSRLNRARQWSAGRLNKKRDGRMNDEKPDWLAREREEIAARVADFRATQKRFEKEREEYYASTLKNAWDGFNKPIIWN